jgi:23S rRNA (guanine745-N1)-methyltransferase
MNDAVLTHLRCPHCAAPLRDDEPRALRCVRGHSFDIARQGYASLIAGRTPHTGDSAEMVADRAAFLAAGHYAFIADAVAATLADEAAGLIVDAGTGTGYYLARVLDAYAGVVGLGLDVSKPALRRAARAHPRAVAALADLWRPLPLADASAAVVLDVFAPRNGPEFRRILRPDGVLLVVTPAADHLAELIDEYGLIGVDPDKSERTASALTDFRVAWTSTHRARLTLAAPEIATLIGMTPSARHPRAEPSARPMTVTAAVDLTTYRTR